MRAALRLLALLAIVAGGPTSATSETTSQDGTIPVKTGAQLLASSGFAMLADRRVALIANHTARVGDDHLADLIHASPNVTLAALFGPEHGLRGLADASERVADGRDATTGVPIYSLYGRTRQPTRAMLRGVDIMLFDIQDIGARFYTYISTMGLAMQAAARHGVRFIVLDRPNPLGGLYVAGFSVHRRNISFVSQYPVPLAHGLTTGELARMIKGEKMLPGLEDLQLEVVGMEGWRRDMLWPDTGLEWVPTSPNIPDFETAFLYPGSGLFEATAASEGRGTGEPFKQVGAPWADGPALAAALAKKSLPGIGFEAAAFTPRRLAGMAADPKWKARAIHGVKLTITDIRTFRPVETGIHLLHAFREQARARRASFINRPDWLAKLTGTTRVNGMLRKGFSPERIIAAWKADTQDFRERRKPYLLYK